MDLQTSLTRSSFGPVLVVVFRRLEAIGKPFREITMPQELRDRSSPIVNKSLVVGDFPFKLWASRYLFVAAASKPSAEISPLPLRPATPHSELLVVGYRILQADHTQWTGATDVYAEEFPRNAFIRRLFSVIEIRSKEDVREFEAGVDGSGLILRLFGFQWANLNVRLFGSKEGSSA
jgi:hypothetical protein